MTTWNDERRARQRELIAHSAPWRRSTGPRSAKGKKRSAQNARKHGNYSAEAQKERLREQLTHRALFCLISSFSPGRLRCRSVTGYLTPVEVIHIASGTEKQSKRALDKAVNAILKRREKARASSRKK